ncbi:uncharacterized protein LOC127850745 [Dreissena polymorpha]|uniref:uncharacterized protein LOC127850745 n=1 Tax=Dreissena polymorpha TaxID=45954 RepID=UPI00226440BC|nr:uncharacterized protein LOC127850745 [Dreissena polymorpha]
MVIIGIFLLAFGRLVAGVCNTKTGPAGSLECVAFKDYNYKYQWSTCLSDAYIQRKSGGTHQCVDRTAVYCYYQCMLESHELGEGPVYYDCACDPNSPLKSPLPAKCYSPDGTDCSWPNTHAKNLEVLTLSVLAINSALCTTNISLSLIRLGSSGLTLFEDVSR